MTSERIDGAHPDVRITHDHTAPARFSLRLIPCQTPNFPYGLELGCAFGDRESAVAHAIQVQLWLDALRKTPRGSAADAERLRLRVAELELHTDHLRIALESAEKAFVDADDEVKQLRERLEEPDDGRNDQ